MNNSKKSRSDLYLTDAQYLATLERLREAIVKGMKLKFFDDDTIGNKDTQCTWGLCGRSKVIWTDLETHLWPNDPRDLGKPDIYGIKYIENEQKCPMDTRIELNNSMGCYYTCRVFQAKRRNLPTKEETIKLYDLEIKKAKGK